MTSCLHPHIEWMWLRHPSLGIRNARSSKDLSAFPIYLWWLPFLLEICKSFWNTWVYACRKGISRRFLQSWFFPPGRLSHTEPFWCEFWENDGFHQGEVHLQRNHFTEDCHPHKFECFSWKGTNALHFTTVAVHQHYFGHTFLPTDQMTFLDVFHLQSKPPDFPGLYFLVYKMEGYNSLLPSLPVQFYDSVGDQGLLYF